jgi:outer membrane protein OmpA-like peptidoglycan-associated protein
MATNSPPEEVENSTKAVNYGKLNGSVEMDFTGTPLAPQASGVAEVKSKPGGTTIIARFKNLPPASSFGGEFLTYVLWGISTEGQATNLGELVIQKGSGKIKATDQLQTFAMVVTAEPYFAVTHPSEIVVMENAVKAAASTQVEIIDTKYQLLKRDQYSLNLDATKPMAMDPKTPFEVYQARNALRIARAAGGPAYARDAFEKAQADLLLSETESASRKSRIMEARASVQSSEDARLISVRQRRTNLDASNKQKAQDQLEAATSAQDAALQQAAAAHAGQDAALQQAAMANAGQDAALQQAADANAAEASALDQAAKAQADNADLRAELLTEFNSVLETRATARGLIVNMTGVLFEHGKATLLPNGREKLAKIAGILATHKGLMVEADGYTDSTGTAEFNLRLSEQRAENARDYLVSQGVAANTISYKGFGVEDPVASNKTDAGRQENRRVELVVSGNGITSNENAGM